MSLQSKKCRLKNFKKVARESWVSVSEPLLTLTHEGQNSKDAAHAHSRTSKIWASCSPSLTSRNFESFSEHCLGSNIANKYCFRKLTLRTKTAPVFLWNWTFFKTGKPFFWSSDPERQRLSERLPSWLKSSVVYILERTRWKDSNSIFIK